MEKNQIRNWPEIKDKLQAEFPHLTTEDLIYEIGKEEELLERLQKKLDKNADELKGWLSLMG